MFISLEGMEGCGKSTQCAKLAAHFTRLGHDVLRTREPGGSNLGQELRGILLNPKNADLTARAELFLYLADRAQHVASIIQPALALGRTVICDRFADSTIVYQGFGRGIDQKLLSVLNAAAIEKSWPDVTVLLDLDPKKGLQRALARNQRENTAAAEGRFEAEHMEFHTRIRNGYLQWAAQNRARFLVIDADQQPDDVFSDILRGLEEKGLV